MPFTFVHVQIERSRFKYLRIPLTPLCCFLGKKELNSQFLSALKDYQLVGDLEICWGKRIDAE